MQEALFPREPAESFLNIRQPHCSAYSNSSSNSSVKRSGGTDVGTLRGTALVASPWTHKRFDHHPFSSTAVVENFPCLINEWPVYEPATMAIH
jgi:hypothetical protein